ncbi:MAG: hypothetical protein NWP83_02070, partial [Spirosomaceae bacterium]|nr:hypothetical protein [Spirosomataceae bacterium]
DLNYPCIGKANWTSSQSTNGGTPGKLNASAKTNPDTTPPKLLFFDAEASGSITFDFDEKLDTNAVKDVNNFVFSSTNGAEKVEIGASASSFRLILSNPLAENELVDISLKNITDCSGNVASDINLTVGNLPPTDSGAVVFNEVLFNPKLGGGDYIELYNRSENA